METLQDKWEQALLSLEESGRKQVESLQKKWEEAEAHAVSAMERSEADRQELEECRGQVNALQEKLEEAKAQMALCSHQAERPSFFKNEQGQRQTAMCCLSDAADSTHVSVSSQEGCSVALADEVGSLCLRKK